MRKTINPDLVFDKPQAEKFLTLLDEEQERFTFQTFDDQKNRSDKSLVRVLNGTFEEHYSTLTSLNRQGAGVYVTVNETDLLGRRLENIIRPRAIFQEADRPGTPEPPLTPHIVVESSPRKFHRYLLVEKDQRIEWSEWEGVMRRMVAAHGSDPNAKDRARVLRLPGFYHQKNPEAPHLVRIVDISGDLPYSWGRITKAIPPMDEPDRVAMVAVPGRGIPDPLLLKSALGAVSPDSEYGEWLQILMALHHASGGSAEGLALADEWSMQGQEYKEGEVAYKWSSFGKYSGPPVTVATIYQQAVATGWSTTRAHSELFAQAVEIARGVVLVVPDNPNAYLEPTAQEAFRIIRSVDPLEYERLRMSLKAANSKIRLGALDSFTKSAGDGADEKQSQAAALTALAAAQCELFHDADGNGYASFDRDEHREHWRLDSSGFREWLAYLAHADMDTTPNGETIRAVINTLTGLAKFDGEELKVFTRVAHTEIGHWIDLGDDEWRAILVTATGWQIVKNPPVKFIRSKNTRPLPSPERGGEVAELWGLTNIPDGERPLVLAWILEALRSGTPYPVLEFIGEQGSAKSTTQALLRRFIDNSKVLLRGRPKSVEDIFVAAAQNHVVSYENLSSLSPEMSDALCSISTGAGYAARQFFTNGEEATMTAHNPVMLNGIGAIVTRPDLLDRTVAVILPTITNRMSETEIQRKEEAALGRIMGAILDLFAGTLAKLPMVKIEHERLPRMADFALLGEAMSQHMGHAPDAWLDAYISHRRDAVRRTIDASPVAVAVIDFVGRGGNHRGTVKELLTKLNGSIFELERGEYWPRSPKGLGDSLRRVAPALRQIGIQVSVDSKARRDGVHCQIYALTDRQSKSDVPSVRLSSDAHHEISSSPSSQHSPSRQRAML